jgi:cobaltochelatase CobS
MRTFNRPMTPAAALTWCRAKLTKPEAMYFAMSADNMVLKLGSLPRIYAFRDVEGDRVARTLGWQAFVAEFGSEDAATAARVYATEAATVPATVPATEAATVPATVPADIATMRHVAREEVSNAGAAFATMVKAAAAETFASDKLAKLVQDAADKLTAPTVVTVRNVDTGTTTDCGIQHSRFPTLLAAATARTFDGQSLNIALVGPAGTGKTTAAKMLGKALNRPVYLYSAMDNKYEFVGYRDVNGQPVKTNARQAWSQPSVILFDEIDACANSALLALNGALANGIGDFADGNIERHPDCVVLAGANTWDGATSDYNGREKLDAAVRDRFVKLDWTIDEALELHFAQNKDWCKLVQAFRKLVADKGIRGVIVSPRATIYGDSLIRAGMSFAEAAAMTLKSGLSEVQFKEFLREATNAAKA